MTLSLPMIQSTYIYIYIYAWIGVMQMTNGLILNRATFNNLRFKKKE